MSQKLIVNYSSNNNINEFSMKVIPFWKTLILSVKCSVHLYARAKCNCCREIIDKLLTGDFTHVAYILPLQKCASGWILNIFRQPVKHYTSKFFDASFGTWLLKGELSKKWVCSISWVEMLLSSGNNNSFRKWILAPCQAPKSSFWRSHVEKNEAANLPVCR